MRRRRVLRSHFDRVAEGYRARRLGNRQMMAACAHFGEGLARTAFYAWRNVLVQAKSWFLLGEQAHLEHAFSRLRQNCSGAARAGHKLMHAAGLDLNKRMRAAFNRLTSYAQRIISMHAVAAFWCVGHAVRRHVPPAMHLVLRPIVFAPLCP